jgi:cardiolipin synthase A/B
MGMTIADSNSIADACSNLVGQVSAQPSLADAIVVALESGKLTASSGPVGISNVLKGAPGSHHLKEFLKAWNLNASHLGALDVSAMVKAALACYRLSQRRAHLVETVWTGPEVLGSEVRRTEAVVTEMLLSAEKELLIVGYWLVTSTVQIRALIETLIQQSRKGIRVRFVFDPGEKSGGPDNFSALNGLWPHDLSGAPREVYSWSQHMTKTTNSSGQEYDRKLHAKVIVADRYHALVTSANLTHAGLLENLEMGFRVQGVTASAVVRHFELLIDEGILERRF